MNRLYFMRHGLSLHNQIGKFSGRINSPLTDEGRQDVRKTAESLIDVKIDTIVCSPLDRAVESAQIVAEIIGYPIEKILQNDLFSERDFGILEGTTYIPLAVNDEVEDIESLDDLVRRAQRGYDWLKTIDTSNILLVSHGALGRALRYIITQDKSSHVDGKFHNAEVVRLI